MDKSGTPAKAATPSCSVKPTPRIEFGCEHLQEMMSQSPKITEQFLNSYTCLQSAISKNPKVAIQTVGDSKASKNRPSVVLCPTFLCTQCTSICTIKERDAHRIDRKHIFYVESRSGCLHCGLCDDFVYDPELEKVRRQQPPCTSTISRKRKPSAICQQDEDDKFLFPNLSSMPCQTGSPRGLYNLGLTCYMSAILQAMIHNPLMRNYFLAGRHSTADCTAKFCIACALTRTFTEMLTTDKIDGYPPVELLYRSWKSHPGLAGYQQQDAHEYFQFMLNALHESVGCEKVNGSQMCRCLYHQTFSGRLRSTIICMKCKNVTETEDPFIDLSLDIQGQVKRRKLDANGAGVDVPLDLAGCLANFTSSERLTPDGYTCGSERCGSTSQVGKKRLTIKKLPPTLCIQIKRYEHKNTNSVKINTKLDFPLQLDMVPYTTRALRQKQSAKNLDSTSLILPITPNSSGWYDLFAVIVHIGKIDGGHYIAYCRRDNQWFKFDDHKVTLATEAQVLDANAYLLFYLIRSLGPARVETKSLETKRSSTSENHTAPGGPSTSEKSPLCNAPKTPESP